MVTFLLLAWYGRLCLAARISSYGSTQIKRHKHQYYTLGSCTRIKRRHIVHHTLHEPCARPARVQTGAWCQLPNVSHYSLGDVEGHEHDLHDLHQDSGSSRPSPDFASTEHLLLPAHPSATCCLVIHPLEQQVLHHHASTCCP